MTTGASFAGSDLFPGAAEAAGWGGAAVWASAIPLHSNAAWAAAIDSVVFLNRNCLLIVCLSSDGSGAFLSGGRDARGIAATTRELLPVRRYSLAKSIGTSWKQAKSRSIDKLNKEVKTPTSARRGAAKLAAEAQVPLKS
jgi:hypothetical protein